MFEGGVIEELSIAIGFKPKLRELDRARKKATEAAHATDRAWKESSKRVERAQEAVAAASTAAAKKTAQRWLASAKQKEQASKAAADAASKAARHMEQSFKSASDSAARESKALKEVWTGALRSVGTLGVESFRRVAGAAAQFVGETIEGGRRIKQEAADIGASTTEYQRLSEGFKLVGIEADNTFEGLKTMRENLGELERLGTGPARDALNTLGLGLEDIVDLPVERQFKVLSEAMKGLENDGQRLSVAIELMGEDGRKLLPAFREGAAGVQELGDAAERSGVVMEQDMLDRLEAMDGRIRQAKAGAKGFALDLFESSIPALEKTGDTLGEWVSENDELIQQDLPKVMGTIGDGVLALAAIFGGLIKVFADVVDEANAMGDAIGTAVADAVEFAEMAGTFLSGGDTSGFKRVERGPTAFLGADSQREADQRNAARSKRRKANRAASIQSQRAAADTLNKTLTQNLAARDLSGVNRAASLSRGALAGERERFTAGTTESKRATTKATIERLGSVRAAAQYLDISETQAEEFAGIEKKRGRGRGKKKKKDKKKDPLMSMLLGQDVPDVELSKIARGAEPQTLISTINNTFTFDIDQAIDGAGDPQDVAQRAIAEVKDQFQASIAKATKTVKVRFAR